MKYIKIKGKITNFLGMLYLIASRETQEPRNKFNAKKWIQKANKKLSVEKTVYKLYAYPFT